MPTARQSAATNPPFACSVRQDLRPGPVAPPAAPSHPVQHKMLSSVHPCAASEALCVPMSVSALGKILHYFATKGNNFAQLRCNVQQRTSAVATSFALSPSFVASVQSRPQSTFCALAGFTCAHETGLCEIRITPIPQHRPTVLALPKQAGAEDGLDGQLPRVNSRRMAIADAHICYRRYMNDSQGPSHDSI